MPAFNVSSDVPVKPVLRSMGVSAAFDQGEFGRISMDPNDPLTVGEAKHKAVVEVTKEGTVGAAATGETLPTVLYVQT